MKKYITPVIRKTFNDKALIVPTYSSAEKEFYSIKDFEDFSSLQVCLAEVSDYEANITKMGVKFLKECFGFKGLAEILYENKWYSEDYSTPEAIYEWLQILEKSADEYEEKEGKFKN